MYSLSWIQYKKIQLGEKKIINTTVKCQKEWVYAFFFVCEVLFFFPPNPPYF